VLLHWLPARNRPVQYLGKGFQLSTYADRGLIWWIVVAIVATDLSRTTRARDEGTVASCRWRATCGAGIQRKGKARREDLRVPAPSMMAPAMRRARALLTAMLALHLLYGGGGAARASDLRWLPHFLAPAADAAAGATSEPGADANGAAVRTGAGGAGAGGGAAPCSARPELPAVAALVAAAAGDAQTLFHSAAAYFRGLVVPRVAAGCSMVSLAHPLGRIPADLGRFAPPAANRREPGSPRIAKLLVASNRDALSAALDGNSLHIATQWAYAKKHGYDVLVYTHMAAVPRGADPSFLKFFVKAAGVLRALFVLNYDYAMLTGA
jgi:hypothetical protein